MEKLLSEKVAVLGCGRMGSAMVEGWLRAKVFEPSAITATTATAASAARLREKFGIPVTEGGNAEAAANASVVVLAVKPWLIPKVLDELRLALTHGQLVLSVAASVPLGFLAARLHGSQAIVARAMPNLPVAFGQGVVGFAATAESLPPGSAAETRLHELLAPLGTTLRLEDGQIDALTALAGSGPAYIYMVIEAMTMAGVKLGLPGKVAAQAAAQTVLGAAWHVKESGEHPAVLRDAVTTPGGTTIAALHELEKAGLTGTFLTAMDAAAATAKARGEQILRNLKA